MDWSVIVSAIGLSSIISTVISCFLGLYQKKKERRNDTLAVEKERKYQHILAMMIVSMDSSAIDHVDDDVKKRAAELGIDSSTYCNKQLEIHMNHMCLYASNSVMSAVEEFYSNKNQMTYKKVARAMYKDLWG